MYPRVKSCCKTGKKVPVLKFVRAHFEGRLHRSCYVIPTWRFSSHKKRAFTRARKSLLELAISKSNFSFRLLIWKHLLLYVEIQNDIFNSKDAKDGFLPFHGHVFTYGDLNCFQATFCNKIINFNTLPRVQKEQKETPVMVELWAKRFV